MTKAAKWLRGLEILLVVAGLSLLGVGFAATVQRWNYQARQEQAMTNLTSSAPGPAASHASSGPATPWSSEDALALGRITIPRIGVKAMVRQGDEDATLNVAVGHLLGSGEPGERGNIVLAGHRDTFFRELRKIRVDDLILLEVPPHTYRYRVAATQVVAPDAIGVLAPTPTEVLTLVTCYPFGYIGNAPKRFIVRADRINEAEPPAHITELSETTL